MRKQLTIDVSGELHQKLEGLAKAQNKTLEELLRFVVEQFAANFSRGKGPHSVRDIKPIGVGKILMPWTSRAELLGDFFDREDDTLTS
jgi:hypothetical protein